jgi:hypothetical protein
VEGFCCQVPSEPRLDMQMSRTNFEAVALPKQRDVPLRSCHLQLLKRPDIGGTMPSENKSFTPSSILFRPHIPRTNADMKSAEVNGGGAGYRPRVRMVYYESHLSP